MRTAIWLLLIACTSYGAESGSGYAIRCGRLLDPSPGRYATDVTILVNGAKVQQVGPAASITVPAGFTSIDLSGSSCLPGLIDVHDHLTSDPSASGYQSLGISIPRSALTGAKNARLTLEAGFTTVRNVGANGYADIALRDAIEAGEIPGPRLLVSGPALGITGGHCDDNLLAPEYHYVAPGVADGPWAARAKVREVVKYGADLIKICASGGVLSKGDQPGTPQYTMEEIKAIVEEAHKLGRKVAAHAHGTQSIKDAIVAGVDSIEHSSLIDAEGIALAKQHGTYLVFDIYNDKYILEEGAKAGMLPESIEKEKRIGRLQRENFRAAWKAGTKMAFGTDGGVYPHGDNAKQFAYMVEYGMQPVDAIRAATTEAATLMGMQDQVGQVAGGYFADLIAVKGDPLKDVSLLERVDFVMKDGKIAKR